MCDIGLYKTLTFICFGYWFLATFGAVVIVVLKPQWRAGTKISFSNPVDVLMLSGIMSWLAMWCFRTMY